jgi:predicted ATPase
LVEAELLYQRGRPPHARYLFKHALIQDAAYASLLRSTRQQVHQRIAQVLEERFPDTVETQPELLAHHYTEAGQYARALDYRQQAGQRARTHSAHVEAVAHLSAGLDVLSRLPDTPTRRHQELALYLPLSASLLVTRGNGSADVEQAYLRARELCEQLGETTQLARVLFAMCGFYTNRAEFDRAQEMATQLLDLAQRVDDSVSRLAGHHALGITLFFKGAFATAHAHLERAMALDTSQRAQSIPPAVALVARTATYFYAALVRWMLGYPEQARQCGCEALTLARQHDNPFNLAAAHDFVARVHLLRREPEIVHAFLETSLALSIEHGFPHWTATGTVKRGWTLAVQGEPEAGIAQIRHGMAIWRRIGSEGGRPWMLGLLAEAYGRAAQNTEGFEAIAEALALTKQTGEGVWTAELYRLKGDMLLAQDNTRHQQEEAEGCLQQALAIARQQQARSWELRAATSLARLWQSQDKRQAAYDLLAPVYDWFTEGFDTADLKEAKALLDTLRG